jgi:hypothetical protein
MHAYIHAHICYVFALILQLAHTMHAQAFYKGQEKTYIHTYIHTHNARIGMYKGRLDVADEGAEKDLFEAGSVLLYTTTGRNVWEFEFRDGRPAFLPRVNVSL